MSHAQLAMLLEELVRDPAVEFAEPDYIATSAFVPNDSFVASEGAWHLTRIQAPGAWNFMMGKPRVVVAVLDSGVNPAHPDLAGRLLPEAASFPILK